MLGQRRRGLADRQGELDAAGLIARVAAIGDRDRPAPAADGVVESSATPSVSVAVPRVVDPSSKVTVPVGTPVPGLTTLTVASSVTVWPKTGATGDAVTTTLVALAVRDLVTGEVGNQEVGDRRAQPGGQVVAGPGGVAVVAVE